MRLGRERPRKAVTRTHRSAGGDERFNEAGARTPQKAEETYFYVRKKARLQ